MTCSSQAKHAKEKQNGDSIAKLIPQCLVTNISCTNNTACTMPTVKAGHLSISSCLGSVLALSFSSISSVLWWLSHRESALLPSTGMKMGSQQPHNQLPRMIKLFSKCFSFCFLKKATVHFYKRCSRPYNHALVWFKMYIGFSQTGM